MTKKGTAVLLWSVCLLIAISVIPAGAADMVGPVGDVTVYRGTPDVDGEIGANEYAGARTLTINHTNMKALPDIFVHSDVPETLTITAYQLWDDTGLYLAFAVDDITPASGSIQDNNWQFNGDNLQIFLDPGPTLAGQMLLDTEKRGGRRSPMYTIGLNEDGTFYYLRQLVENEMIVNLTESPPACMGKATDAGWTFEMSIPWDMLLTDINEKVDGSTLSASSFREGLDIAAMFIYNDVEIRGDIRSQIGMYETSLHTSSMPFDWQPEVFGIHFTLSDIDHADAPPYVAPTTTTSATTTFGRQITVAPDDEASTPAADENTLPLGTIIVVAASALAIAATVTVLVLVKRKKNS